MIRPRYYIEVEAGGEECSSFEPRFASYDLIVAEGDTLEELLETASVFVSDQDGGELGEEEADEDWMQELILESFKEKYCDPTSMTYDPPERKISDRSAVEEEQQGRDAETVRGINRRDP